MDKDLLYALGGIALWWNRIENDFLSILKLYVNTDAVTLGVILKPMRPTDQEILLRRLVDKIEPTEEIKECIFKAITCCGILRKNRNLILHSLGSQDGNVSEKAIENVSNFSEELPVFHEYFVHLVNSVRVIILDRESREIQADAESGDDEIRPFPEFVNPQPPHEPERLEIEDIE